MIYDYSKVEYYTNKIEVEIICLKHGSFWQRPHNHFAGNGCGKCFLERNKNSLEEFKTKANLVHHFLYDYSKFIYTGMNKKSIIICSKHRRI